MLLCVIFLLAFYRLSVHYDILCRVFVDIFLQVVEFLLSLKSAAGEGFDLNFTDTLQGETGRCFYHWTMCSIATIVSWYPN